MKTIRKLLFLVLPVLTLIILFSCKKDKGDPSVNLDEAAAARVAGTFRGTIDIISQDYPNAIIIVTKESGNKIKVAAKTGEAYSNVTTKTFSIKAISNSDDAEAISTPEGTVVYQHSDRTIRIATLSTASGDITFDFRGAKQ